jgi:hypothetical protein
MYPTFQVQLFQYNINNSRNIVTQVRIFSVPFCLYTCSFCCFFVQFFLSKQLNFFQVGCIPAFETGCRLAPAARPFEHGYRPSGSIKGEEFLDKVWEATCFSQRPVFYGVSAWLALISSIAYISLKNNNF